MDDFVQAMPLSDALGIPRKKGVTAIVGGGGKTSLMYALAREWAHAGLKAITAPTTRIGMPRPNQARLIEAKNAPEILAVSGEVICVGEEFEAGKLRFPGEDIWARCVRQADRVFAEADGSRNMPIKAPASHEPVIPQEADTVVAVAGLTALGQPLERVAFRWELVCEVLGTMPEAPLTPQLLARLLTSERGQRKGVADSKDFRIFLNQADNDRLFALGAETAEYIKSFLPGCVVAIGALQSANLFDFPVEQ